MISINLIYDIIKVEFMPIILHGIASVMNSILISTASFIISMKSLSDNLFCNLPYNITACATCSDSSREIYSLDRHNPGKIFFFLIQKIEAKLELKRILRQSQTIPVLSQNYCSHPQSIFSPNPFSSLYTDNIVSHSASGISHLNL